MIFLSWRTVYYFHIFESWEHCKQPFLVIWPSIIIGLGGFVFTTKAKKEKANTWLLAVFKEGWTTSIFFGSEHMLGGSNLNKFQKNPDWRQTQIVY